MAKQIGETATAEVTALAVQHPKAAGIDVGDATHWVCVAADGGDAAVRAFPAHTPGLRELVAWLRHCGVTTVALEATRYLVRHELRLSVRARTGPQRGQVQRRRPTLALLFGVLRHPLYAGAYAYGRRPVDPRRQAAGRSKTGQR